MSATKALVDSKTKGMAVPPYVSRVPNKERTLNTSRGPCIQAAHEHEREWISGVILLQLEQEWLVRKGALHLTF